MSVVEVIQDDITTLNVDAIVNAANEHLQHGGGVAAAISRAAGPELQAESNSVAPVPTGSAKATKGYNLAAKWVIHAVGPRWLGGNNREAQLLESAYRSSIRLAAELGAKSLAFPSISTAIFGYPVEEASKIAIKAILDESNNHPGIELIQLCTFSDADFKTYSHALSLANQIQLAKDIATRAHVGQKDKSHRDYIDHPRRVVANAMAMPGFETLSPSEKTDLICSAWLHDVIEDAEISQSELVAMGITSESASIAELLTRDRANPERSGDRYYENIRNHKLARMAKIADVADNCNTQRRQWMVEVGQTPNVARYENALEQLQLTPAERSWFENRIDQPAN
jgi:O-acetyl-ADP-ribose deacetylase